jgi:hypothetical protein
MKTKHISVDEVRVHSYDNANVGACIREAAMIAFTENRTVILTFNDRNYTIDPSDIVAGIIDETHKYE